jgi:hypothetical protein
VTRRSAPTAPDLLHNAHMLIPKNVWDRLVERATIQRRPIKALVVDALRNYLER